MTSSQKLIKISLELANCLLREALDRPHQEVCGLVACDQNNHLKCYPIKNTATSPDTRFEMDSQQLIATTKLVRDLGHKMFAVYHSHPNGNITPSAHDIQQCESHDLLYIIISPGNDGLLNLGAYWINQDKSIETVTLCSQG